MAERGVILAVFLFMVALAVLSSTTSPLHGTPGQAAPSLLESQASDSSSPGASKDAAWESQASPPQESRAQDEGFACPPPGFDSFMPFNITAWTADRWYSQMQMVVEYLPPDRFYCTTAKYTQESASTVRVENLARVGSVTGPTTGGQMSLTAAIPDLEQPSKLKVGPWFLPRIFYGDYWVVYAGPSPSRYEFGIISGGPPKRQGEKGCICGKPSWTNDAGLWLFTRKAMPSGALVSELVAKAKELGFDTSVLLPVEHEGCSYPD